MGEERGIFGSEERGLGKIHVTIPALKEGAK